jgi:serine/threonine-protein kinase
VLHVVGDGVARRSFGALERPSLPTAPVTASAITLVCFATVTSRHDHRTQDGEHDRDPQARRHAVVEDQWADVARQSTRIAHETMADRELVRGRAHRCPHRESMIGSRDRGPKSSRWIKSTTVDCARLAHREIVRRTRRRDPDARSRLRGLSACSTPHSKPRRDDPIAAFGTHQRHRDDTRTSFESRANPAREEFELMHDERVVERARESQTGVTRDERASRATVAASRSAHARLPPARGPNEATRDDTMSIESAPRTLGRYRLHDQIASGGMATVHFGRLLGSVGFSRIVAIKRLHANYAQDPDFLEMFLDEARLAARIRHPNVVTTLDVEDDGEEVFLVMEYIHGESLSRLLSMSGEGGIPVPIASAIVCGLLEGLHAAHEATDDQGAPLGLVHRDVSPQNVLLGADGVARVFDFGIAKAATNSQQTREGVIKGKVSYMAPEQVCGIDLDRRADLYSVGVVLWELLVGRRLHGGERNDRLFLRLARGEVEAPTPPSTIRGDVPSSLDAVIARAVQHDRDLRWSTAREMALAIEAAVPPAPPRVVADWLAGVAVESLAASAAVVRRIEREEGSDPRLSRASSTKIRAAGSVSERLALASSVRDVTSPSIRVEATEDPVDDKPARRRWPWVLVAVAAVLIVPFVVRTRGPVEGPRSAGAPLPSLAEAEVARANATAARSTLEAATPSASASVTATLGDEPAAARPRGPNHPRPKAIAAPPPPVTVVAPPPTTPAPTPTPTAKPAPARPACDNPFMIGPDGIRQVRPECI